MTDPWKCQACHHVFTPGEWSTDIQCPRCGSLVDDPDRNSKDEEAARTTNIRWKGTPPETVKSTILSDYKDLPRDDLSALEELDDPPLPQDVVQPKNTILESLSSRTELGDLSPLSPSPSKAPEKTMVELSDGEPSATADEEEIHSTGEKAVENIAKAHLPFNKEEMISILKNLGRAFGPALLVCLLFSLWITYDKFIRTSSLPPPPSIPVIDTPISPVDSPNDEQLSLAIEVMKQGDWGKAETIVDDLLAKNPDSKTAKALKEWLTEIIASPETDAEIPKE